MASVAEKKGCSKRECDVSVSGHCAEGHEPPEACPYYGHDVGNEEIDADDKNAGVTGETFVPLPEDEPLSPAEVDEFLRWRPAVFVTIVGQRDSGKTTLICAIYDRFLKGPFAGCLFAGSRTLVGLEKHCHLQRVESGLPQPDTPHTSVAEGLRFFHFAVAPEKDPDHRIDLLLSDRSGEVYVSIGVQN